MNVISPSTKQFAPAFVLSCLLLIPMAGRGADPIIGFAKAELGLDLGHYSLGSPVTKFPEIVGDDGKAAGSPGWRKVPIQQPAASGTNATHFAELRFVDNRLVEVRTRVLDFSDKRPDNILRLERLRKLGAKPMRGNPSTLSLSTAGWRIVSEGFCSATTPFLVQFNLAAPNTGINR